MAKAQSMAPVLVASHPRSGTHLTIDLLRRQFASCRAGILPGQSFHDLYLTMEAFQRDHHRPVTRAGAERILGRARRPTLKTHLLPTLDSIPPEHRDFVAGLVARATKIYCVRDGRAVMCSYRIFKRADGDVAIGEFIRQRVDGESRVARWARHVRTWTAEPGVLVVPYEHLIEHSREQLARIAEHLDEQPQWRQPILPRRLRSRTEGRIARLLGRGGSTTIVGRPRGAAPRRWQELFDEADREFFHQEAGDLLTQLGYEADDSWVAAPAAAS